MASRCRVFAIMALSVGAPSCSGDEGAVRAQWVLVLDTDAPLVAELARGGFSSDAAIDTLRLDVYVGTRLDESRTFLAPSPESWPVSLGVVPSTEPVTVRARAFRSTFATNLLGSDGNASVEPLREATIDRLVRLGRPEGVAYARVVLETSCLGAPASFAAGWSTCASGERDQPPTRGLELTGAPASGRYAQSSPLARESACDAPSKPGARCVPGGLTLLGEPRLQGFDDANVVPLKPVVLSPFLLDETELTVGRFRALVLAKKVRGAMPVERVVGDTLRGDCTWRGADVSSADTLPLNCIEVPTAEEVCALEGGTLPSEAEWEHAARGRGERRAYPWGAAEPTCCIASVSRKSPIAAATLCEGRGVEVAGAHPPSAACGGIGDVSRDGVLDLGGSLGELVRDKHRPYSHRCWGTFGLLVDPVCVDDATQSHTLRGGDWSAGTLRALSALRSSTVGKAGSNTIGFRCRYPGARP